MNSNKKRPRDESIEINENEGSRLSKKLIMPNFLLKLYQILETNEYRDVIEWGENGKFFVVKNLNEFTDKVCPKFFKHNNFSSFVRQLNMYDFHKKRSNANENIFQHKNFIKGQKNLIRTIKRKNYHKDSIVNNLCVKEEDDKKIFDSMQDNSKRLSKTEIEAILQYLIKTVNDTNEKQKQLEHKVEILSKQNEEFLIQNQQIYQELISKNNYTKKLEALFFYTLDFLNPKQSYKNAEIAKNILGQTMPSNTNVILLPNSQNEIKTKVINEKGMPRGLSGSFDKGFNENLVKNLLELFRDNPSSANLTGLNNNINTNSIKRDKMDFLPMLASNDSEAFNYSFNDLKPSNSQLNILNKIANSPLKTNYDPKIEFDDNLQITPNPFEDYNLFNSPKFGDVVYPLFSRNPSEMIANENNEENLVNFQRTPKKLSRNGSIDMNEIFRTAEVEKKSNNIEKDYVFDDSYFSVSSDKQAKSSNKSEM